MSIHHSLGCSQRIINNNPLSLIPYDSPQVHVIPNAILPTNNPKLQSPHTEELVHLLLRQRVHGLQRQQDLERDVGGLAALVLGENESSVDTINNFSIASSGVPIRMS